MADYFGGDNTNGANTNVAVNGAAAPAVPADADGDVVL
jgi:hypothetical protein